MWHNSPPYGGIPPHLIHPFLPPLAWLTRCFTISRSRLSAFYGVVRHVLGGLGRLAVFVLDGDCHVGHAASDEAHRVGGEAFVHPCILLSADALVVLSTEEDGGLVAALLDAVGLEAVVSVGVFGLQYQSRQPAELPRSFADRDVGCEPGCPLPPFELGCSAGAAIAQKRQCVRAQLPFRLFLLFLATQAADVARYFVQRGHVSFGITFECLLAPYTFVLLGVLADGFCRCPVVHVGFQHGVAHGGGIAVEARRPASDVQPHGLFDGLVGLGQVGQGLHVVLYGQHFPVYAVLAEGAAGMDCEAHLCLCGHADEAQAEDG